jgi:hypothetical protein
MKKSELKQIIKEEIAKVLNESTQKSLNEGNLINPQTKSSTNRRTKEYLDKLRTGKKGDRLKMFGSTFNKEINNFDRYSYEVTLLEPFKRDPQRRSQYYAPADYKGETIVIKLSYGDDDIQLFKNGKMWTPATGETSREDFIKSLQK